MGAAGGEEGEGLRAPLLVGAREGGEGVAEEGGAGEGQGEGDEAARVAAFRRRHGGVMAVVTGCLGGLVLLPMDFAPYECRCGWQPCSTSSSTFPIGSQGADEYLDGGIVVKGMETCSAK